MLLHKKLSVEHCLDYSFVYLVAVLHTSALSYSSVRVPSSRQRARLISLSYRSRSRTARISAPTRHTKENQGSISILLAAASNATPPGAARGTLWSSIANHERSHPLHSPSTRTTPLSTPPRQCRAGGPLARRHQLLTGDVVELIWLPLGVAGGRGGGAREWRSSVERQAVWGQPKKHGESKAWDFRAKKCGRNGASRWNGENVSCKTAPSFV